MILNLPHWTGTVSPHLQVNPLSIRLTILRMTLTIETQIECSNECRMLLRWPPPFVLIIPNIPCAS